jgi:hypothetical protein
MGLISEVDEKVSGVQQEVRGALLKMEVELATI